MPVRIEYLLTNTQRKQLATWRLRICNEGLMKGMAAVGKAAQEAASALRDFGVAIHKVYYLFILEWYAKPFFKKH